MMRRWFRLPLFLLLAAIALVVVIATGVSHADALQAMLQPANPKLGETVSVLIATDRTPEVTPVVAVGQKQYAAFPIAPYRWRAFIPTTPLDRPGDRQVRVVGGRWQQVLPMRLENRNFPTQSIWLNDSGGGLEPTDYEWNQVSAFKQLVTPQKFWRGPFLRPNDGEITTGYGVRRYYNGVFADDYYHRGVDYAGGYGSPVVAPAAGQVRLVGTVEQGFRLHGNTVGIDHGQGVASIFIHLSRITVREGEFVQAGQVIGAVGATGAATGPHLHWGLYVNGECVDPIAWRYTGVE